MCAVCLLASQVEEVSTEVHRLSRCLSQAQFPSSGSTQTDEQMGEQASVNKVADITVYSCCHMTNLQLQLFSFFLLPS